MGEKFSVKKAECIMDYLEKDLMEVLTAYKRQTIRINSISRKYPSDEKKYREVPKKYLKRAKKMVGEIYDELYYEPGKSILLILPGGNCVIYHRHLRTAMKHLLESENEPENLYMEQRNTVCPGIRKIIHNGPATIIFWKDCDKTVSICSKDDTYNEEIGTFMAILKKLSPELVKEAIQIEKAYKDKEQE